MNLREAMPITTAFIDQCRQAFGKDEIDAVIREGLKPGCRPDRRFFASEAGHQVGQRRDDARND